LCTPPFLPWKLWRAFILERIFPPSIGSIRFVSLLFRWEALPLFRPTLPPLSAQRPTPQHPRATTKLFPTPPSLPTPPRPHPPHHFPHTSPATLLLSPPPDNAQNGNPPPPPPLTFPAPPQFETFFVHLSMDLRFPGGELYIFFFLSTRLFFLLVVITPGWASFQRALFCVLALLLNFPVLLFYESFFLFFILPPRRTVFFSFSLVTFLSFPFPSHVPFSALTVSFPHLCPYSMYPFAYNHSCSW